MFGVCRCAYWPWINPGNTPRCSPNFCDSGNTRDSSGPTGTAVCNHVDRHTTLAQMKTATGCWFVDPSKGTLAERCALLTALKEECGGQGYSVRAALQSQGGVVVEAGEDAARGALALYPNRVRTQDNLHELIRLMGVCTPTSIREFMGAAEDSINPVLYEALRERVEGRGHHKSWRVIKPSIHKAFWPSVVQPRQQRMLQRSHQQAPSIILAYVNESKTTVTAYGGGLYETVIPTGYVKEYNSMPDDAMVKAMVVAPPFFIPQGDHTMGWGQGAMESGWMFKQTSWFETVAGEWGVEGFLTDFYEEGATRELLAEDLRSIFRSISGTTTVVHWMTEEEHGVQGANGVDGFPPPLLQYWLSQPDQLDDVARRMNAKARQEQYQQGARKRAQQELGIRAWGPEGPPPASWLPQQGQLRVLKIPVLVWVWQGASYVETHTSGVNHVEIRKASAVLISDDGDEWAVERGKAQQWRHRQQQPWDDLWEEAGAEVKKAEEQEAAGYRTPAWQITQAVAMAGGLDTLVDQSIWEADPTFQHWGDKPGLVPLVMLDTFPRD